MLICSNRSSSLDSPWRRNWPGWGGLYWGAAAGRWRTHWTTSPSLQPAPGCGGGEVWAWKLTQMRRNPEETDYPSSETSSDVFRTALFTINTEKIHKQKMKHQQHQGRSRWSSPSLFFGAWCCNLKSERWLPYKRGLHVNMSVCWRTTAEVLAASSGPAAGWGTTFTTQLNILLIKHTVSLSKALHGPSLVFLMAVTHRFLASKQTLHGLGRGSFTGGQVSPASTVCSHLWNVWTNLKLYFAK